MENIGDFVNENGSLVAGTRIASLGTLYAGTQHTTTGEVVVIEVPTDSKSISIGTIPNNLGLVIHASELLVFEGVIESKFFKEQPTTRNSPCKCGSGLKLKHCREKQYKNESIFSTVTTLIRLFLNFKLRVTQSRTINIIKESLNHG